MQVVQERQLAPSIASRHSEQMLADACRCNHHHVVDDTGTVAVICATRQHCVPIPALLHALHYY